MLQKGDTHMKRNKYTGEIEANVTFINGNKLHAHTNTEGYIDFTAWTCSGFEIDGGQYDIKDIETKITTLDAIISAVLNFMGWEHWGSYSDDDDGFPDESNDSFQKEWQRKENASINQEINEIVTAQAKIHNRRRKERRRDDYESEEMEH